MRDKFAVNKAEYFKDEHVLVFVSYVAKIIAGDISVGDFWPGFGPAFNCTPAAAEWRLEDLFRAYTWRGRNFVETTRELRDKRRTLCAVLRETTSTAELLAAFEGIFDWGMDAGSKFHNLNWAKDRGDALVEIFREGVAAIDSDTPDLHVFRRARMNAGYTKIYAIPSRRGVIYDSRVGAAFCWLVRQFLLAHPEHAINGVPEGLRFRVPAGKGKVPRNPSGHGFVFGSLVNSDSVWAMWNIRANWILDAALDSNSALWCRGRYRLRRIEAALFMLGYHIEPSHAEVQAVTPAPTKTASRVYSSQRLPLPTSFAEAFALLAREPDCTVSLYSSGGRPFSATAKFGRDRRPKIVFSHNNVVDPESWDANCNHYGQRIGQYVRPLAHWAFGQLR